MHHFINAKTKFILHLINVRIKISLFICQIARKIDKSTPHRQMLPTLLLLFTLMTFGSNALVEVSGILLRFHVNNNKMESIKWPLTINYNQLSFDN